MVFKEHPPDTLEKSIRFGCGTVFGILIALYSTRRIWLDSQATVVVVTAVVAIVSGGGRGDADTGKPLGWPPEPLVLHGSFDRLPLDTGAKER